MMEMEEMGDINGGHVVANCSLNKNEVENVGGFRNVRDRARDVKRDKIRDLERDRLRDAKRVPFKLKAGQRQVSKPSSSCA